MNDLKLNKENINLLKVDDINYNLLLTNKDFIL